MPTAMPDEPLTSRFGSLAGRTDGSFNDAIEVVDPLDRFLVEVLQHLLGDLVQAALGVPHGRRFIAVDRAEVALAVDRAGNAARTSGPCGPASHRRPCRRADDIFQDISPTTLALFL